MNLEELKVKWTDYDWKLDTAIRLNETRIKFLKPKASLRKLFWFGLSGMVLNGAAAMLLGTFIAAHLNEPEFWFPAVVLHVAVVAHIAFAVRQWLELKTLDYSAPVLFIQKRLAGLRLLRVRLVKWTFWLSPLLWTPFLIVSLKGIFGMNVYETFSPSFLLANLTFGVAFLLLVIWMARRFADRFSGSHRLEQMMDHFAGRSLTDAMSGLKEITDFEQGQATV